MPTAKAQNVPKILNNSDLKAADSQKNKAQKVKQWIKKQLKEVK